MNYLKPITPNQVDLLVVEDNLHVLNAVSRMFKKDFARVFGCTQTDQGLTIIETELAPHSVVLSDHHNPLSPYHGAHLALISEPVRKTKNIPFYLMSGGLHSANASQERRAIQEMQNKRIIHG